MRERNQLPRAVVQRALQNVGVFVIPEYAVITCLLAMPAIDACLDFNRSRSKRKPGRTFLSLGIGLGFDFNLHEH